MNLTKNLLTRDEAFALAPEYVKYVEGGTSSPDWEKINDGMNGMKRGQACITCHGHLGNKKGQYVRCKVSSTKMTWQNEDGPVVRVSNGEFSWRVDGCDYAYPITVKKALAAIHGK